MLSVPGPLRAVVDGSYTLTDLEVLEKEGAHQEFFAHAFDVRPSERTDYWKRMMENMGESYLKSLMQKKHLERSDFQLMERLMNQSVLSQYEFYRQRRQEVALKWFQQCLGENSSADSACWKDLQAFWEKGRQEIDLAPRLLAVVGPFLAVGKPTEISELFILSPMLADPIAGLQCKKPAIRQVVWAEALKRWATSLKPQEFAEQLTEVAHSTCWQSITQWSRAFLLSGGTTDELDVTYQLLQRQGEMTALERDLYLVSYLLGSPARGDLFNLAWNRLRDLGLRPQERETLLGHLKRWRPLPGQIFADLDLTKRRAISRHLRQHFPEYLDHYAHVCIDFFGAKKRFPEGNPAYACREMFNLATTERELLPQPMVEMFKQSLTL